VAHVLGGGEKEKRELPDSRPQLFPKEVWKKKREEGNMRKRERERKKRERKGEGPNVRKVVAGTKWREGFR